VQCSIGIKPAVWAETFSAIENHNQPESGVNFFPHFAKKILVKPPY
jgi:hypothetical protein